MKIIAHRGGATAQRLENSLASLMNSAQMGVDMVECDVTKLKDGAYVIFHDSTLSRLTGNNVKTEELTLQEISEMLINCGRSITTLQHVLSFYDSKIPILLHIKMKKIDDNLLTIFRNTSVPLIFGAISVDVVKSLHKYFPPERILAFMPKETDYKEFILAGAGNIRLWENWLGRIVPADIKKDYNVEVWIMANDENKSNRGSRATLDKCYELGSDAVLMDDIELSSLWKLAYLNN